MAKLVIEVDFPGMSEASIADKTGFKGDYHEDINGAVNLLMGCAGGAYGCDYASVITSTSVIGDIAPIPEEDSLIQELMGAYTVFAGLASSTLTNTGSSVVTGDVGVSPGTSITGFPPGTVTGLVRENDAVAQAGAAAALLAYNELEAMAQTADLTGQDLGTLNLSAGVYNYDTSAQLTGTLTLTGSATDRFIFQIGSTLTTASSSEVVLAGGAIADNVAWQVGTSATLGTSTAFQGNIFALASVTANTSATNLGGRFIAITAAVTLDTNTIG